MQALKPSGSQSPTTPDQGVLIPSSGFHRYEYVYLTQTDTYSYSEKISNKNIITLKFLGWRYGLLVKLITVFEEAMGLTFRNQVLEKTRIPMLVSGVS